eukprot:COSAG02_NODE_2274_length_9257_cov_21.945840_3_plen_42_part_00
MKPAVGALQGEWGWGWRRRWCAKKEAKDDVKEVVKCTHVQC